MSFGISRGKPIDTTGIEVPVATLPRLPDDLLHNPTLAHIDIKAWFPNPALPLHLEIGSGKGTFLLQEAPQHPDANWLGIEYEREFFSFAADRLRRTALTNIRMLCLDAGEFVHWRVPDNSCRAIHLYFPDPWPKSRHHKRRMIQDRFLQDALRVLEPLGELRVATDHADYWAWMREHFDRWSTPADAPTNKPFAEVPFVRPLGAREGEVVGTNFERKYRLEGREFHATTLRKLPTG